MDYQNAFAISAAGMSVERLRVEVSALNLANANTVAEGGGAAFQPMRVVARAATASGAPAPFAALVGRGLAGPAATVETAQTAARRVLEPGHPLADAQGYVSYAGVDTTTEMLTIMRATRAYEANVAAMNAARTMAMKALDIGSTP
jgi:flagellar basal-body rod protein FlgC